MFETYKIKKLEKEADINIEYILEDFCSDADRLNGKKYLEEVKLKYVGLKEKFKHDNKKLLGLAIDWKDYIQLFLDQNDYTIARVSDEKGAKEAAEEIQVRLEQIEKRFDKLLKD